jgi:phosphoenolpyruvate carboxykinase (ATP)
MAVEHWVGWSWCYHWWQALPVSTCGSHLKNDADSTSLKYTRAILDAIHSGELAKVEYETYETFNLAVPKTCTGVPSELLNPRNAWTAGHDSFREEVTKLGGLFVENFKKYSSEATEEVIKAGPEIMV